MTSRRKLASSFLMLILLAVPTAASAEEEVYVMGKVRHTSGAGLEGICVTLTTPTGAVVQEDTTGFGGGFIFEFLEAGEYRVRFVDCVDGSLGSVWYDGASNLATATPVWAPSLEARRIEAVMEGPLPSPANDDLENAVVVGSLPFDHAVHTRGASLEDGEPQPACTQIVRSVWYRLEAAEQQRRISIDRGAADFDTAVGLYAGPEMRPAGCAGGIGEMDAPRNFSFDAEAGETYWIQIGQDPSWTGFIRITISIPGTITGRVTGASGAVGRICVESRTRDRALRQTTLTAADGRYRLVDLAAGDHLLLFADCQSGTYADEWYDDADDAASATPVTVISGAETRSIDAALALAPALSGTVTARATGAPLAGACVTAYPEDADYSHTVSTNAFGNFWLGGISRGTYRVRVAPCGDQPYVPTWYNGASDLASATPVLIDDGPTNLQIHVDIANSIAGTVRADRNSQPLSGICVDAFDPSGSLVKGAKTNASGIYMIGGLSPDSYRIRFKDCAQQIHATEWYDDAVDIEGANAVEVVAGAAVVGIDASMRDPRVVDLAITHLSVDQPSDTIEAALDVGTMRTVRLTAANLGQLYSPGVVTLSACPRTSGACAQLARWTGQVASPGRSEELVFVWDTRGWVGDVDLSAGIEVANDVDLSNNAAATTTHVIVKGTGVGFHNPLP